jgi:hypothetical protein
VTEYNIQGENDDAPYEEDDPRSWRNECEGETKSLAVLLDEWKDKYYRLEWMGFEINGWPTIMWADRGDDNYEGVMVSHARLRLAHQVSQLMIDHKANAQDYTQSWVARLVQQGCLQTGLE